MSPASLRILHVATHAQVRRGGAVQICRMATGLTAQGHEVRVLANDGGDGLPFEADSWAACLPPGVRVDGARLARAWGRWKLQWLMAGWRPHVIHCHRDDALKAVARIVRGGGAPVVAQRGTTRVPAEPVQAIFRSDTIAGIVAVANRVGDVLATDVGVPRQKIRTIYGSVDLEKFSPRPRDDARRLGLGFGPGDFVLGSLSAWRAAKGLESILRAASIARANAPGIALLFLGEGVETHLAPLATELGIRDRCRFLGHQEDVAGWLAAMDATVIAATSREGLSGVLRESLACGVPVISTDSDGNGEIVRNGETGLLVPPGDDQALAAAFQRAATDPEGMRRLAAAGREWVMVNCSLQQQAQKLDEWYRELIARRQGTL